MKARKKIIQGGSSAGKTFGIIPILIDKAIKEPFIDITIIGCSVPHLKGGAMKDFLKIMKITKRFIRDNWNDTNRKYTFTNGSTIEFVNADGDKAIGPRRNILYVNEANLIDYNTYNQLAIRTSGDIYIDFNPVNKFWAHSEVLEEADSELLILTYKDNEGLPETVKNELLSKREKAKTSEFWKNWCKVYLDGQIGMLEGVVFDSWKIVDKIPPTATLVGHGLDFGFTNDPSVLIAIFKSDNELYFDEIFYNKGLLNSHIHNKIQSAGITTNIYADSADPKSIAELQLLGSNIQPAQKGPDSIMFGLSKMLEYKLNITRSSVNLKAEFTAYCWKKDKEGNTLNQPIDDYNHGIDAIRYGLKDIIYGSRNYFAF